MRLLPIAILALFASAGDPPFDLRLLPLEDGLPDKLESSNVFRIAEKDGVDLRKPSHPVVVASYRGGRLFHLFYKSTENALGDRAYLIQRMKRVRRYWKTPDSKPEETVEYKVEVFKTIAGALKGADQHFGSYGLGDNYRREIVKEYEIGFGEIPDVCEGNLWPFDNNTLFKILQKWAKEPGLYRSVKFARSRKWSLDVSFDRSGSYRVRSPEFGFDVNAKLPAEEATRPRPLAASREIVLVEGKGPPGVEIGVSLEKDVVAALGEPLERVDIKTGNRNLSFRSGLTVNLLPDGKVNTVFTRAGFAGKTAKGASHDSTRAEVRKLYGEPPRSGSDSLGYDGVTFYFDSFGRVRRIVAHR